MYVFSRFENSITLARNNIFSFRKKFLVAGIPLYQKQPKSENRTRTPPAPLSGFPLIKKGPVPPFLQGQVTWGPTRVFTGFTCYGGLNKVLLFYCRGLQAFMGSGYTTFPPSRLFASHPFTLRLFTPVILPVQLFTPYFFLPPVLHSHVRLLKKKLGFGAK